MMNCKSDNFFLFNHFYIKILKMENVHNKNVHKYLKVPTLQLWKQHNLNKKMHNYAKKKKM